MALSGPGRTCSRPPPAPPQKHHVALTPGLGLTLRVLGSGVKCGLVSNYTTGRFRFSALLGEEAAEVKLALIQMMASSHSTSERKKGLGRAKKQPVP